MMSLFIVTVIIAIALIAKGIVWFCFPQGVDRLTHWALRSPILGVVTFGIAGLWFLWIIAHLGEADFGEYKNWLLLIFGAVVLGSFFYLKDFLFVRGLAILELLIAKFLLDVAYMQEPLGRLFLVVFTYLLIIQALYFAALPYKMRDFFNWAFASNTRIKQFALGYIVYGLILVGAAFLY